MASKAKSMCKSAGCSALLSGSGYCEKHKKESTPFKKQDEMKTEETKKFYRTNRWKQKSLSHRKEQPLCQDCLQKKPIPKFTKGTLVHHTPELVELLAQGLDPYDDKYLSTSCEPCHLGHLRSKKH